MSEIPAIATLEAPVVQQEALDESCVTVPDFVHESKDACEVLRELLNGDDAPIVALAIALL